MHKKIKYAVLLLFMTTNVSALEVITQYYFPSLFFTSSGDVSSTYLFEGNEPEDFEKRYLLAFEHKFIAAKFARSAISANLGFSFYFEDGVYSSTNISLGTTISLTPARGDAAAPQGLFVSFYPLYQLPVFAGGKTPKVDWRIAADIGYGFHLFTSPMYFTFYMRLSRYRQKMEWDTDYKWFPDFPDFGITAGWHFNKGY